VGQDQQGVGDADHLWGRERWLRGGGDRPQAGSHGGDGGAVHGETVGSQHGGRGAPDQHVRCQHGRQNTLQAGELVGVGEADEHQDEVRGGSGMVEELARDLASRPRRVRVFAHCDGEWHREEG
jgi:hypothetical protein